MTMEFSVKLDPVQIRVTGPITSQCQVYLDFILFERWDKSGASVDLVLVDRGSPTDSKIQASGAGNCFEPNASIHRVDLFQDGVTWAWTDEGDGDWLLEIGGDVGCATDSLDIGEVNCCLDCDVEVGLTIRMSGDDPPMSVEFELECSGTLLQVDTSWIS